MVHKVPGHKNLLCSLKQDRSEIERQTKQICIDTVSGWDKLSPNDITVGTRNNPINGSKYTYLYGFNFFYLH